MTRPDHTAITPSEGVNGVWVEPVPELVTGDTERLANIANVAAIRIPGYWQHKKGADLPVGSGLQTGEKVLYNLHGGAYVRMSAHPSDPTANIPKGILKHVPSIKRAFSVEYRLSSTKPFAEVHPFPAALIDALAGYNYLVNTVGIPPSNIIICGDSAGGNLAQALTRYLVENSTNPDIPAPPSALILLSPWSDLSQYHEDLPGGSAKTHLSSDYINDTDGGASWAKEAFCGVHGRAIADTNPYVSPASLHPGFTINFKGFPRTFLNGGGAEVIVDQIRTLRDRMIKDLGEGNGVQEGDGKVRYHEAPDAIHDYLVATWHEPERSDTLRAIAEWVEA
jgi:acetyl esterase/lipase